ncbi:FKBP-type peptidyl-prolyl cis-trans isomerase [Arthrobacter sp. SDTb3-6]|uniref:FKBP-type peptidyl-prolyl cis-trans isomerase n=1 Tax=Arthrobacter sp. SDTb3-6 TaxID=2713571 RepID=UPI00159EB0F8|nr:FKBP-type peptidyl-prolyl cis-trans isomerase [Arthrobacter sp. SDTb3-6]NVM98021.1 peptidylprolyl isomerase [Arthrobacter sp. SDTb3-6]
MLLPVLLLLTACGAGSQAASTSPTASASATVPPSHAEALASVTVSDQGKAKAPKVSFTKPLKITAESMRLLKDGTGAAVKDGQTVVFHEIDLDASTGKTVVENFSKPTGSTLTLSDSFKSQFPLVYATFTSAKVGAYIAYGTPATPAVPASSTSAAQPARAAGLSVFQISSAKDPAKLMSSGDVAKLAKAGGLPTAKFDAKGVPSITIPKKAAPADLAVQVLTEGKGDVIKGTDTISAWYTGWSWSDAKKFDSAYDRGAAASFSLAQVIPGWTMGLTGQRVGSTVLLTIPASLAYGDSPQAGQPGGPLVFVVKIDSKK